MLEEVNAEAKRADVLEALLISQNHPVAGHLALHPGHPAQPTFKGRLYLSAGVADLQHQKCSECSDVVSSSISCILSDISLSAFRKALQ